MPYVNRDGTVGGRKPFVRLITDFLRGIIDFVALFFGALTNPPQRIESRATVRTTGWLCYQRFSNPLVSHTVCDDVVFIRTRSMGNATMDVLMRAVEADRQGAAIFGVSKI